MRVVELHALEHAQELVDHFFPSSTDHAVHTQQHQLSRKIIIEMITTLLWRKAMLWFIHMPTCHKSLAAGDVDQWHVERRECEGP